MSRKTKERSTADTDLLDAPTPCITAEDIAALERAVDKYDRARDHLAQAEQVLVCEVGLLNTKLDLIGKALGVKMPVYARMKPACTECGLLNFHEKWCGKR
jgi:hypothetical protein